LHCEWLQCCENNEVLRYFSTDFQQYYKKHRRGVSSRLSSRFKTADVFQIRFHPLPIISNRKSVVLPPFSPLLAPQSSFAASRTPPSAAENGCSAIANVKSFDKRYDIFFARGAAT
jgi:hypothetical protein